MEIQSLKLAYFSPTGTTKSIVQAIERGINHNSAEHIDVTKPNARKKKIQTSDNDLLVVAVPVYLGRVPVLLYALLYPPELPLPPADDGSIPLKGLKIK